MKYIYYINLREKGKDKNIDTILIGSNRRKNNDYQYNKLIEIDHGTISSQHAIMDYDIEEKSLSLRNISIFTGFIILLIAPIITRIEPTISITVVIKPPKTEYLIYPYV